MKSTENAPYLKSFTADTVCIAGELKSLCYEVLLNLITCGLVNVPFQQWCKISPNNSLFASTTSLNNQDKFIEEVYDNLAKQNISVEMIHSESAPGQLEVVLPYITDVMKLADNVVLAEETIKVCAQKHRSKDLG